MAAPLPEQTVPDPHDVFLVFTRRPQWQSFTSAVATGTFMRSKRRQGSCNGSSRQKESFHDPSPAIFGKTIYIGSWIVICTHWTRKAALKSGASRPAKIPIIYNQVGFQSSPAVVDGVVYVGCRAMPISTRSMRRRERRSGTIRTSKSWVNVYSRSF
jgi:hypothetical protein